MGCCLCRNHTEVKNQDLSWVKVRRGKEEQNRGGMEEIPVRTEGEALKMED